MATIHFLNVGLGDCTIIKHNDDKITVIDVNNASKIEADLEKFEKSEELFSEGIKGNFNQKKYPVNPIHYLKVDHNIQSVFRFILTHPDMDHLGGVKDFFEEFNPVIIPIHPVVKSILSKYNNNLPECPYNQIFNIILKEICRLAGITEKITITKTIGGIKQSKTYEKCDLISCHTGRRTMISNAILEGVSTPSIMLISAHKSLEVFQKYVRITKQQNADVLAKHKFFN